MAASEIRLLGLSEMCLHSEGLQSMVIHFSYMQGQKVQVTLASLIASFIMLFLYDNPSNYSSLLERFQIQPEMHIIFFSLNNVHLLKGPRLKHSSFYKRNTIHIIHISLHENDL